MKKRLPLTLISGSALALIIAAVFICVIAGNYEDTQIRQVSRYIEADYQIEGTTYKAEDMPVTYKSTAGETITIITTLPQDVTDDFSICYFALYCKSEAYVNGKLIGSYGTKMPLDFGHMLGNIRVIIPLTASMAGGELKVVLTPYYNVSNADLSKIMIGPTGNIKLDIVMSNIPRIIMISVLLSLMITALLILINHVYEKSNINAKLVLNFIMIDLFVSSWLFCSSDLPQLVTRANTAVSLASFLSLACITIPYAGFCELIFTRQQRIFYYLQIIGWAIPIAIVLLFGMNITDPLDILVITHLYILAVVVSSVIFAFREPKKKQETVFLLIGIGLLVLACIGGFAFYYIAPSKGYDGLFFGAGFIGFIICLFLLVLSRQVTLIKERQNLDAYKHMAYYSAITGLSNRVAFDEAFESMKGRLSNGIPVTLFMFNLYNHKAINEEHGHQAGDDALKIVGQNIEKIFSKYGICYDLGGDEFATIIEASMVDVRKLKSSFEDLNAQTVFTYGTRLSVLVGYATLPYNTEDSIKAALLDRATSSIRDEEKRIKAISEQA